jgi:hypothetical protein
MKSPIHSPALDQARTQRILVFQAAGFVLLIILLWLNECLDVPHYVLGARRTPINWPESILESAVVLVLAVGTLSWTDRALTRIQYLEKFLLICSFCRKIHSADGWVSMDEYLATHSGMTFSPGLCPECLKRHFPECTGPLQSG